MKTLLRDHIVSSIRPAPMETCDLTVVIVSWNTRDVLDNCLRALVDGGELEGIASSEIIVTDNASEDGSAARVRADYPDVILIEMGENAGFTRASNTALRRARGRHWLLLNSDTIVPRGALAALVRSLDSDPTAAAAGPLLQNDDGSPQLCWARFPNLRSELTGHLDRGQSPYPLADFADPHRRGAMQPFPVDWVGGACLLVRAEAARAVGLMDEGFFLYYEETDWCRRFRNAGWHTLLVPSISVTHLGGRSSARQRPDRMRTWLFRSALRYYRQAYGVWGGLLPSLVAAARYVGGRVKRDLTLRHPLRGYPVLSRALVPRWEREESGNDRSVSNVTPSASLPSVTPVSATESPSPSEERAPAQLAVSATGRGGRGVRSPERSLRSGV